MEKLGDKLYTIRAFSGFGPGHFGWTDECVIGEDDYKGKCRVVAWKVTRIAKPRRSRLLKLYNIDNGADLRVHVTSVDGHKDSWQGSWRPNNFRPSIRGAYQAALRYAKRWDPESIPMIKASRTRHMRKASS